MDILPKMPNQRHCFLNLMRRTGLLYNIGGNDLPVPFYPKYQA
jgi:hypothetical protein